MADLTYLNGFEYGGSIWYTYGGGMCDEVNGTPVVSDTYKHSGSYSARFFLGSPASCNFMHLLSGSTAYAIASFYVLIHTEPSARCKIFVGGSSGSIYGYVYYDPSDHKFEFTVGTATGNKANVVIALDTWYRIDVKWDCSTATLKLDGQVNGTAATQATGADAIRSNYSVRFGMGSGETVTGEVYIDDIIVSETSTDYPLGVHALGGLSPNAEGTHNNTTDTMEDSAGNDIDGSTYQAYPKLSVIPWVYAIGTDYIRQATSGAARYCEVQFPDTSEGTILGVRAMLKYASAAAQTNKGATIIRRSDTTEIAVWGSASTPADMSETSTFFRSVIVTAPGGGWTSSEVNALRCRFGYSTDVNPIPYWGAVILEFAYVPTTGTDLVIENSKHINKSGDAVVTTQIPLVIGGSSHIPKSSDFSLTQVHNLQVGGASHAHQSGDLVLEQVAGAITLVIEGAVHPHKSGDANVTITFNLIVENSHHHLTALDVVLGQTHNLQIQDSYHGHVSTELPITKSDTLVVEKGYHVLTSEQIGLTQAQVLALEHSYHLLIAEQFSLTQLHNLQVEVGIHALRSGDLVLTQIHVLQIENSSHTLKSDEPLVTKSSTLTIENSSHTHTVQDLGLTQLHVLVVENSQHSHTVGNVILQQIHNLQIENSRHVLVSENCEVNSALGLVIENSLHLSKSSDITIGQIHNLVIELSRHALKSDEPNLSGVLNLTIENSHHHLTAGDLALTQLHVLVTGNSQHALTSTEPKLQPNLLIENSKHILSSGDVSLAQVHVLDIQGSLHSHSVEDVHLIQIHNLGIEISHHHHTADNCDVVQIASGNLIIEDSRHLHTASELIELSLFLPTGDTLLSDWTDEAGGTTNIYTHINEILPDDANYVKSVSLPAVNLYKFWFSSAVDPLVHTDHYIALRLRKPPGAGNLNLFVRLKEVSTLIDSWTVPVPDAWTTVTLQVANTASITNYANLYLEFEAEQI